MQKKYVLLFFIAASNIYWFFKPTESVWVWQNYTSNTASSINILTHKDQKLFYFLNEKPLKPPELKRTLSNFKLYQLQLNPLKPKHTYQLLIKNEQSKVIAKKKLTTLNLNQNSFKIAVASCMDDHWKRQNIWNELLSFQPDMIFLIGDVVYADKYIKELSFQNLSRRYLETIQKLPLYKTQHLIPLFAIWDDHDYGMNNGHGNFKYKKEMTHLFRDFFPLPSNEKNLIQGPGISFLLKTKHQNFLFTDGRSFRSPPHKKPSLLWGREQEKWILDSLSGPPTWMISGGQILGRHHRFESFEKDFPLNFKQFLPLIMQSKSPVFFLSGDRHLSELLKIEQKKESWASYNTYELTTSPIHAKTYPETESFKLDPRHIHHRANKLNYAIITSKAKDKKWTLQVEVYGFSKKKLFSENLNITPSP